MNDQEKPLTTAEKIHAIETSGLPVAYDGCHKIYFLEDDKRHAEAVEFEYQIHPASEIRKLILSSCGLVFVSRWGFDNDDFDHRWNIRQGTQDLFSVAEGHVICGLLTDEQRTELRKAVDEANRTAEGDSNDREIEALNDALDTALAILGIDRH
jgi:hypothetical protein